MKTSNKIILGLGLFIMVLIVISLVQVRILFDRTAEDLGGEINGAAALTIYGTVETNSLQVHGVSNIEYK